MNKEKKEHPKEKPGLHPRNKHRGRYDFNALCQSSPELSDFVGPNKFGDQSINFSDPDAVKTLNKSLLKHYYGIENWEIPENYLCPPIPGRADYLHYVADLLAADNEGNIPKGSLVKCLDIGTGANCIYPIIGFVEYGWDFIGSDIDKKAVESAKATVASNSKLKDNIDIRLQADPNHFFKGVIKEKEVFDVSICNPPFHASKKDAEAGTMRKLRNLNKKSVNKKVLNFGGNASELIYEGGENEFIRKMILESKNFAPSFKWFTTLISKEANLKYAFRNLKAVKAKNIKNIPMSQGNKVSRFIAWNFSAKGNPDS